ncbi:MAG: hypothetical protein ACR2G0_02235 [Chthoniobacterales bacterium]
MKTISIHRNRKLLATLSCLCVFVASSAWATVVTWNLNPDGLEGPINSPSYTFVSSGYSITANGYTAGSPNTPLGLYFKSQGVGETGLGVIGPDDHELQGNGASPVQFIQFDVGSIIAQGFTDGMLQVGSVQADSNDQFVIYGSSTAGTLGTQIGGAYDSSSDLQFVSIANFTSYNFISIGAISGDVLPVAFQASLTPVPEMSALFPIIGLVAAVSVTQILRRRKIARDEANSPALS